MKTKIKTIKKDNKKKVLPYGEILWEGEIDLTEEQKWTKERTLVEVEKDKCLIFFPIMPNLPNRYDARLGLIAILKGKNIDYKNKYKRPAGSNTVYKRSEKPEDLVYEFDIKYTNKIKKIEKAYFTRKMIVDAFTLSQLIWGILSE